jgi:hypothetical protein
MIRIIKSKEPNEWLKYRKTPGVSYQATPELRKSLAEEQGYICAYCMSRIELSNNSTRIEHILSQANHEDLSMDYSNMVLCCKGCLNDNDPSTFHCDRKKGEKDLHCSPLSESAMNTIKYSSKDGTISSSNTSYDKDLNDYLNLNVCHLKSNRLQTLDGLIDVLKTKGFSSYNINHYLDIYNNPDQNNMKKPYCGIVIWFLKKKLGQKLRNSDMDCLNTVH